MVDKKTIERINFLAKKSRCDTLTPDEAEEQQKLRSEYVAAFRQSLCGQLDNTVIVRPDGTRQSLSKNKKN